MEPVRVLDLGLVPPLRSQAIYHGIGYAMKPETPDTLILVSPSDPYVCIGYHQELEKEVDVEYCGRVGLPVYRREVGGGAVYLDQGQLFTQWAFKPGRLPASIEGRFALYVRPLVETYRSLGIPANHRPVNDIHVHGKKIGGTGAAQMNQAELVVGSLMFDFDFAMMARVLKVSSEKMRDKVRQSLDEYMTTLTRELGRTPDREQVKGEYLRHVASALGRPLEVGEPTPEELAVTSEMERRLASDEWLHQKGGLKQTEAVKIHADVYVAESAYKAPGGLIRATLRVREGRIDDLSLSGDFTLLPIGAVAALEQALRGAPLDAAAVRTKVAAVYKARPLQSPGVRVEDWVEAVMAVTRQASPQ